ncbi:hypothetical protein EVJ58_g37 [Rhodofomes roseus]|uniref:Uncharacterized protein n=1 Tax=Rhodofomes roseus TaxID=34475 RepID=A0A4Y9Z7T4_9APHY|nr:hypothetical protein EVJ58_g37 [Rhodofomes roseus]
MHWLFLVGKVVICIIAAPFLAGLRLVLFCIIAALLAGLRLVLWFLGFSSAGPVAGQ